MKAQRLRARFTRGEELKYITHLDLMRFWERALRRARIAVAYSEGFSPHPQISLAAPLPVGVISSAEQMDIFLAESLPPDEFVARLSHQLPPGLRLLEVREIALPLPSIQSQMRAAEYRVEVDPAVDRRSLQQGVDDLLASTTVPWKQQREREVRSYDLRPLILDIVVEDTAAGTFLRMRLLADNTAAGRPDQVMAALGLAPSLRIERIRLVLADEPIAAAWERGA